MCLNLRREQSGLIMLQCFGLGSRGTQVAWNRSQVGAKAFHQPIVTRSPKTEKKKRKERKEPGASRGSATSLCTYCQLLPPADTQSFSLFCFPMLILTHTGGCTQLDPAAQQALSPDSPSRPPSRPSGTGCPAGLRSPQSASPAARPWDPPPEARAL